MLTNQMLIYKHRRVVPRIVIMRIESIAKTPKLNLKINLGMSSDLKCTVVAYPPPIGIGDSLPSVGSNP